MQLGRLARIKHEGFESEREWRLTIPEHFQSMSESQRQAMNQVEGFPKLDFSGFPPMTVEVEFYEGGPALFKPYTAIPFEPEALTEVVLGPNVNAELAKPLTRRLLDRYGFDDTEIVPSALSYRA